MCFSKVFGANWKTLDFRTPIFAGFVAENIPIFDVKRPFYIENFSILKYQLASKRIYYK